MISTPRVASLDLDFVRSSFPALAGDWVFLDNAGGSQTLASVADRVRDYLLTTNVQLGATYEPSRRAAARVAEGVAAAAPGAGAGGWSCRSMSNSCSTAIVSSTLGRTIASMRATSSRPLAVMV